MAAKSRHVALAVEPLLLADALTRVLEGRGYVVVRADGSQDAGEALRRCVVVVLSEADSPVPSTCQLVVQVPGTGLTVEVADVQGVLDVVEESAQLQ